VLAIEGTSEAELASDARGLLRELRSNEASRRPALAAEPEPQPSRAPKPVLKPVPPRPDSEQEASSNDWLGYSLLGVAAVSAGLMVFSWNEIDAARNDRDFRAYREAIGSTRNGEVVRDVCAEADAGEAYGLGERLRDVRSACGRGETCEVLQWVFAGSALVCAGLGIYFLLDDEGEPDGARAFVLPQLGQDNAGLKLRIQM